MALHKMALTDGELAAVKGYRAENAARWAAYDSLAARLVEFAGLSRAGHSHDDIAARFKRVTLAEVKADLKQLAATLDVYRARPRSSWPAAVVDLIDGKKPRTRRRGK